MLMIRSTWPCGGRIVVHLRSGNQNGFYREQSRAWRFPIHHTLFRGRRPVVPSDRLRDAYAFDPPRRKRTAAIVNRPLRGRQGEARDFEACVGTALYGFRSRRTRTRLGGDETGVLAAHGRPVHIADAVRRIAADVHGYEETGRWVAGRYEKTFTIGRAPDAMIPVMKTV